MWHLHWRADARHPHGVDTVDGGSTTGTDGRPGRRRRASGSAPSRGTFQHIGSDTPDAAKAADVPESVRVRGR